MSREHRQPDRCLPWSRPQVRVADSWPARRDQPVSVALTTAGDRLALSIGQRLTVADITDGSRQVEPRFQLACALVPGLTWSPGGDRLAYRAVDGQGRLAVLPRPTAADGAEPQVSGLGAVSAMAFAPDDERLAILAPALPGRPRLTLVKP